MPIRFRVTHLWRKAPLSAPPRVEALQAFAVAWTRTPHTESVRANSIWSAILKDDRPIMIVIGNYYLSGKSTLRWKTPSARIFGRIEKRPG
jgi:hypothetical protein